MLNRPPVKSRIMVALFVGALLAVPLRADCATGNAGQAAGSNAVSAVGAAGSVSKTTALGRLAASMHSGQWASFTSNDFNHALVDAGGGHSILEFASRGHWDPLHKKIQFWGMGHLSGQALITYDDATNTWTRDNAPATSSNWGHGYQHMALDPATGDLYLRLYNSGIVRKKPYDQPWQNVAAFDNSVNNQVAGALEWVPQLNGGAGGLAFADAGGVRTSNAAVSNWGWQISGASGQYHQNGVAINGAFYFGGGGGSTALWRLDPGGAVTRVADSPVPFGVTAMDLVPHPNGVDALLVGPGTTGKTYLYNAVENSWILLGPHQLNSGEWWVGITVPEYGITIWLCEKTSASAPFIRIFKL
ncbi:MAG: hypothetical protein ABI771_03960 [Betaproteobacteria bacterium]